MKTSIVLLTRNALRYTRLCLRSLRRFTPEPHELIVVDNGSTDGTPEYLARQPDVRLIRNRENRGFPAGCNQGLAAATGDRLLLLNNDTVVTPGWLAGLLRCLEGAPGAGLVGPVTNEAAGAQRVAAPYASLRGLLPYARRHNRPDPAAWEPVTRLIGFCLLMDRAVWEQVGPLDEAFTPGNYEDDDYSIRALKAGFRLYVARDTYIHHFGSRSWAGGLGIAHATALQANLRRLEAKHRLRHYLATAYGAALADLVPAGARRVLEVGYGLGAAALSLRHRGSAWAGLLSWDPAAADIADRVVAPVVRAPEGEFPAELPKGLDAVVLPGVLDCCPEPRPCLQAAAALVRPGGWLVLDCENAAFWGAPGCHDWLGYPAGLPQPDRPPRAWSLAQVQAWLRPAGLALDAVEGTAGPAAPEVQAELRRVAGALAGTGRDPDRLLRLWSVQRFAIRARRL